jgi:hypothetical protein
MLRCIIVATMMVLAVHAASGCRDRLENKAHQETEYVINCITWGEGDFVRRYNRHPTTVDECVAFASEANGALERWSAQVLKDVSTKRDGWGRPLQFEREPIGDGVVKITVISLGENGKREYAKGANKGDDLVGTFYLEAR